MKHPMRKSGGRRLKFIYKMKMKPIIINEKGEISGKSAFLYHTSYGFPPDFLLELNPNKRVDMEEYEKLMKEHQKISAVSSLKKFGHKSKKWG